jgi:hypothetical protein
MKRYTAVWIAIGSVSAVACQLPGFSSGGSSGPAKSESRNSHVDQTVEERSQERRASDTRGDAGDSRAEVLAKAPLVLPAGTRLTVALTTGHDSGTSHVGDTVSGTLASPVVQGDTVVLPEGSELRGTVTTSIISGKTKGRGQLGFRFDAITVRGEEHPIALSSVAIEAKSGKGKDAKVIGGSAAAGGLIGAIAGGKKGALIGAGVGAGAGTGYTLATRGEQAKAPVGSKWTLKTTQAFAITMR